MCFFRYCLTMIKHVFSPKYQEIDNHMINPKEPENQIFERDVNPLEVDPMREDCEIILNSILLQISETESNSLPE
jgi:hypothetical protein